MADHRGHADHHQRYLPAEQVAHRGRGAAIGHMHDVDAGPDLQQFPGQVRGRAAAGRRIVELAGACLREGDELLQRTHRQGRMRDQDVRHAAHERHRGEALHRVERYLAVQRRVHRQLCAGREQQRVAVGCRLGHEFGRDVAASPGAVLDQHLLSPALGQLLADAPGHDVGRAARREGQDHADGLYRVRLRSGRLGGRFRYQRGQRRHRCESHQERRPRDAHALEVIAHHRRPGLSVAVPRHLTPPSVGFSLRACPRTA